MALSSKVDGGRGEAGPPPGSANCPCLPKRVTARMSSSESLEGARVSVKKGAAASGQRFWYNVMHKLRGGGGGDGGHSTSSPPGLGTYSGVLIPTCENMWGKDSPSSPVPLLL